MTALATSPPLSVGKCACQGLISPLMERVPAPKGPPAAQAVRRLCLELTRKGAGEGSSVCIVMMSFAVSGSTKTASKLYSSGADRSVCLRRISMSIISIEGAIKKELTKPGM